MKGDPYQEWDEAAGRGKDLLLGEKGGTGFPYLVFMDEKGDILAKQGDRSVAGFEATVDNLQAWKAATTKAKSGDKAAAVDVVIAEMGLGKLDLAAADKALAGLVPSPGQQTKIDALRINLEFDDLMKKSRELGPDGVSERVLAMKSAGKIPSGGAAPRFWSMLITAANRGKDVPLFEEALKALKELKGGDPAYSRMIELHEKNLAKLKGE